MQPYYDSACCHGLLHCENAHQPMLDHLNWETLPLLVVPYFPPWSGLTRSQSGLCAHGTVPDTSCPVCWGLHCSHFHATSAIGMWPFPGSFLPITLTKKDKYIIQTVCISKHSSSRYTWSPGSCSPLLLKISWSYVLDLITSFSSPVVLYPYLSHTISCHLHSFLKNIVTFL